MALRTFTVHDLPVEERPRERLQQLGGQALSAQELLALVLGRGVNGEPVMNTAQRLLAEFGSLKAIVNASLIELQAVKGLGIAKASQLVACLEIARRVMQQEHGDEVSQQSQRHIASAADVYRALRSKLRRYRQEHLVVLALNSRDRLISLDTVTVGTSTASVVHPGETFAAAMRQHAASIIVAHNHPSGDVEPSAADRAVTRRLFAAGNLLGIALRDHVIISTTGYFSFREEGLLE